MDLPPDLPRVNSGRSWIDLVVAGSVIFISLVSLFIALRQSKVMEKQLEASVWPYLQFDNSNFDSERQEAAISIGLENVGVGPARIAALSLDYQGKPIQGWSDLIKLCCNPENRPVANMLSSNVQAGSVIPANKTLKLFQLKRGPEDEAVWQVLNTARFKVGGEVCYCSVLDQCYVTKLRGKTAVPVNDCSAVSQRPQFTE